MPLVTNARVPLSPNRSPRYLASERQALSDKEGIEEEKEEGSKAFKLRRRQKSPPSVPVEVSSKESPSVS